MEGRGMCYKVWTAQRLDSLAVIMIEWSLIDGLSLQDLQSTSVLWMRPLWKRSAPFMWSSAGLLFPAAWFMSTGALLWPGQACSPNHQVGLKTIALSTINELKKQRATTTATIFLFHSLISKHAFTSVKDKILLPQGTDQQEGGGGEPRYTDLAKSAAVYIQTQTATGLPVWVHSQTNQI